MAHSDAPGCRKTCYFWNALTSFCLFGVWILPATFPKGLVFVLSCS